MAVLFVAGGCNVPGCLNVGGTYQGAGGEVEYCWNAEKSKSAGAPAFDEKTGEKKKTLLGISEDEIKEIIDKFKEKIDGIVAKSQSVQSPQIEHPLRELRRILKEKTPKPEILKEKTPKPEMQ